MEKNAKPKRIIEFTTQRLRLGNSIIVLLDLQNEYIASGRAYSLAETKACLKNCKLILDQARASGFTIIHFRTILKSAFFNPGSYFCDWINDFSPHSNEMVFERSEPSIFANPSFNNFLQHITKPNLVILGLTGERGCLATAIDSSNRDVNLSFVHDASASSTIGDHSEQGSHAFISKLIFLYSEVVNTHHILMIIK